MHRGSTSSTGSSTTRLAAVIVGHQLGERDVSGTASRAGTCRRKHPKISRPCSAMAILWLKARLVVWSEICLNRWVVALTLGLRPSVTVFSASLQQDAAGFGTIWGWGCQRPSHGCETPFLHISFDENESSLAEVDVDSRGSVGADSGEEILVLQSMAYIIQLLAVPSEENATCSGTVPAAYDIALDNLWPVRCMVERLVETPEAIREVGSRVLVEACQELATVRNASRQTLPHRHTG